MIIYGVNESYLGDDAITISVHSTLDKAEEAKEKYERSSSKYTYWIEEFQLDLEK